MLHFKTLAVALNLIAVLLAACSSQVQAQSSFPNEGSMAPLRKTYSQVFNFDDLTKNQVPLRVLLEVEIDFYSPVRFVESTKLTGDDELGTQQRIPTLYITGERLFEVKSKLWSLTKRGAKIQVLSEDSWSKDLFLLEPVGHGHGRAPIGPGYLSSFNAIPITLGKNTYPISIQLYVEATAAYEKTDHRYQFLGYSMGRDERISAKATLFQKDSGRFLEIPTEVPEGIPVETERCEDPGQSRKMRDLVVDGLKVSRIMYCYPDSEAHSFQRMILPWHKPLLPDALQQDAVIKSDQEKIDFAMKPLWNIPIQSLPETNCHGYSLRVLLGNQLEIPEGATWIQGMNSEIIESYVPLPFLLQKYFDEILSLDVLDTSDREFLTSLVQKNQSTLNQGDLITFSSDGDFVHSGILVKNPSNDNLWVQSKFAQGPIFTLPLEFIGDTYHYKTLKIFRKKSNLR